MKNCIVSKVPTLRDPFVLLYENKYYMYGTGWVVYTADELDGDWEGPFNCVNVPTDAASCMWAPEVHLYNGKFYMFTTYLSAKTDRRGVSVFRADSPMGPFTEISDGHYTPKEQHSIDGTLYIDKDGKPWSVYVHEWIGRPDKIGLMSAARMSDDLTRLITEPLELFSAVDGFWCVGKITDGPFLYTLSDGKLIMIWSNFDKYGYAVGMIESESGLVTGPWKQLDDCLYTKNISKDFDGGHGMLFRDKQGTLRLALHSPNSMAPKSEGKAAGGGGGYSASSDASLSEKDRYATPIFCAVTEKDGKLCIEE